MKRRNFLKLAAMAAVAAVLPTKFRRQKSAKVFTSGDSWGCFTTNRDFGEVGPHYQLPDTRTIFKITSIDGRIGFESCPHTVRPNEHGYLLIPEDAKASSYALYAPMQGFEQTGPWYLIRTISRREARRARFTITVPDYRSSDLIAKLPPSPYPDDHMVSLNLKELPLREGQDHWKVYFGSEPSLLRQSSSKSKRSLIVHP